MRGLRILKCRGVAHSSNEMPMLVSSTGLETVAPRTTEMKHPVFSERISSGVERLDTMLDGGYLRGTCTLISGAPGTSKTSLAGAFAAAACNRRERTLFAIFDEGSEEMVRNLASVNVRLARFVRSGLLRIFSVAANGTTPEALTLRISSLLDEHGARCLVVDPASALIHAGASEFAIDAVLGLLDFAKRRGVTVLMTSVLDGSDPSQEESAIGISTIADTWMRLSYVAAAGERNRALTIVKSRGTGHSNQVRELILSSNGLSLVDVYTARQLEEPQRPLAPARDRASAPRSDPRLTPSLDEEDRPGLPALGAEAFAMGLRRVCVSEADDEHAIPHSART
jgi:circadian clock protein KaiC